MPDASAPKVSISARAHAWLVRKSDYLTTFRKSVPGRRVFAHLFRKYHMLAPVTAQMTRETSVDPIMSAFRDGQRSVIVDIIRVMDLDDAEVIRMYQENPDE